MQTGDLILKRQISVLGSFSVASLLALNSLSALASPLSLKQGAQGQELTTSVKAERIGRLALPDGQLRIRSGDAELQAVPDWLFDRHTVLKGKLISAKMNSQAPSSLELLLYFNEGDWLKEIYKGRRTRETLTLKSGNSVSGNVRSITATDINFEVLPGKVDKIALADIVNIDSPFAFKAVVPVSQVKINPDNQDITADAGTVSFTVPGRSANSTKVAVLPPSNLPGTEGGITKGKIVAMVGVDTVNTLAPLIAIPIVVPLGERSAQRGLNAYQQADFANYFFNLPVGPDSISRF